MNWHGFHLILLNGIHSHFKTKKQMKRELVENARLAKTFYYNTPTRFYAKQ